MVDKWEADYTRGWTEGVALFKGDKSAALAFRSRYLADADPSAYDMGKSDAISELRAYDYLRA